MTSRDEEFLAKWHIERPGCQSWGGFVRHHLCEILVQKFGQKAFQNLFKIPVVPRLKDDPSLLQKAFYRGKDYVDPFNEIEDKVGLRVVLLLGDDVRAVGEAIQSEESVWDAVKARDHADEIAAKPYEFDYQSLHYIVRSKGQNFFEGTSIPDGLPCEIQIRTILQHAYSEITHDTLYKPSIKTTPKMKRSAAKSMALIEATGDYFDELDKLITEQVRPQEILNEYLISAYQELVTVPPSGSDSPLNKMIIDYYAGFEGVSLDGLRKWIGENKFIGERIRERKDRRSVFQLPAILLAFFCASTAPNRSKNDNPMPDMDLETIFSDLGKSLW